MISLKIPALCAAGLLLFATYGGKPTDPSMVLTPVYRDPVAIEQAEDPAAGITMTLDKAAYKPGDDAVTYTITNTTGESINVVMVPTLERCIGRDAWEPVPMEGVGFCGTPDTIEDTYTGEIKLSWYGDALVAGEYRLSFSQVDDSYEVLETISAIVIIEE